MAFLIEILNAKALKVVAMFDQCKLNYFQYIIDIRTQIYVNKRSFENTVFQIQTSIFDVDTN